MPATAFDAKGLLMESIFGEDPTIIIEHRSLFSMTDQVPSHPYRVRFGKAAIRRPGKDITLAAIGCMVPQALRVAERLAEESIDVEVIDLRTVSPLDEQAIWDSVRKTRKLAVADAGWQFMGAAAEVIATVSEKMGSELATNPVRITLPNSHTPMSAPLEQSYYPDDETIADTLRTLSRK
jgi:pyruvate dehydrogenase E1 component beta subunit